MRKTRKPGRKLPPKMGLSRNPAPPRPFQRASGQLGGGQFSLRGQKMATNVIACGLNSCSPKYPWEFGVSEQPLTDRFLQRRQSPATFHPVEGEPLITASRSKQSADGGQGRFFIGRFPTCLTAHGLMGLTNEKAPSGGPTGLVSSWIADYRFHRRATRANSVSPPSASNVSAPGSGTAPLAPFCQLAAMMVASISFTA